MRLIKEIQGVIFTEKVGSITYIKNVTGELQREDYINLDGLVAYLQDFSKVEETKLLVKPPIMGLVNQNNNKMITLQINY